MIKVRLSTPADGGRAVEIWRSAVRSTHDFVSRDDMTAIDAEVEAFLPSVSLWLACDDDGAVLGFMGLTGGHLESLFVDAASHGRGVGRCLVEHAVALAGTLTTDVNEQNLGARAFYERLGFVAIGRSPTDDAGRPYPLVHLRRQIG